ncbi:Crp/Fnr family transcriptional regulator [Hyphomicrobium sp.]|uniref:Crp/Fnr family transcriptional regulator n=1 Tax=Hyphomicrobium sp. TaxID=82 RepID=UPI002B5AB2D3|nr:Crp/Fnr family transcriptional regulator [Hyphomicrobium sp.]HVZ03839.1 Crp/Fnr family transcriptional regulator [Hyphomicrobium sp.]
MSFVLEDVGSSAPSGGPSDFAGDNPVRTLAREDILFEAGDLKTHLYKIETGALCISETRPDGSAEVIEFALAGDLVGMGFLERHAVGARAVIDTTVRCYPLDAMTQLATQDERTRDRFDRAVQREFTYRRDYMVTRGRFNPLGRLAAFLQAVSQQNAQEGRDPSLIDDTLECAVVADYLGVSVDVLGAQLVELEKRRLIEPAAEHGLRITDAAGLKELADDECSDGRLQSDLPAASKP